MSEIVLHPFVPPVLWVPIALVFAFVLLLELRKPVPHRLLRLVSLSVLLLSLTALILHPYYRTAPARDIMVQTQSSRQEGVDSLLQLSPELRVYRLAEVPGNAPVMTAGDFHRERQHIRYLTGAGLPVDWLQQKEDFEIVAAELPEGITSLQAPVRK